MAHINNDDEIMSEAEEPVNKHFGLELLEAGQAAIAQDNAAHVAQCYAFAPEVIQLGPRNPAPTGPRQASQPISINSSKPASQTNPLSYADMAGTDGSVWKTIGKKSNPHRNGQNTTPNPHPVNQTEVTCPYLIDKLKSSTKPNIIAHAQLTFSKQLSSHMKKDQLIVAYQQAQAEAAKNSGKLANNNSGRQCIINTTEWTISHKQNIESVNFTKPFNGDAVRLIQHIQTALRQNTALPEPPLTLIVGWWSSGLTSNFVLTFTGHPPAKLVEAHQPTLLEKFLVIFDLFCNEGLKKYIILGVPMVKDAKGCLPSQQQLFQEFACNNLHYQQWQLPIKPVWA
jgi:hypothetical protein